MKKTIMYLSGVGLAIAAAAFVVLMPIYWQNAATVTPGSPTIGSATALNQAYNNWKVRQVQYGEDGRLVLPLGYVKGLSAAFTQAKGKATLDLVNGALSVEVTGLPTDQSHDIWLIDNGASQGQAPD